MVADAFIIVILDMDSAPQVEYSDVVPCGVVVGINNYLTTVDYWLGPLSRDKFEKKVPNLRFLYMNYVTKCYD